jgi:CRISPR/Cas system-associated endoribonuclease Cas2
MKAIRTFAWAAALSAVTLSASAQTYRYDRSPQINQQERALSIDERQARQEQRIQRGVSRGDITPREARQLWRQQREIDRAEAHARADGRINRREMRELTAMLDEADQHIRHQRRDVDRPYWRG